MCDPIVAPIVIGAIGIGMQAYGMSQQAKADRARKRQAEKNAANSRVAAVQAVDQSRYEASRLQMRADQLVSHIRVVGAAGNVDLSRGSSVRLQTDAQVLSTMDQHVIEMRGIQKAAGYITQGDTFSAQAAVESAQATANLWSGAAGIARSASDLAGQGVDWWAQQQPTSDPSLYNNGTPKGSLTSSGGRQG